MLCNSGSSQSSEPLSKKVTTKGNGAIKEGIVQATLDKSEKEIATFGHQMSISGISYLIERLSYKQYLAVNKIGFSGFWAIRTNVISKSLGMWLLENYDRCGSFLNLLNRRILEFTKKDVHSTLRLPRGPKKRRRWGISSGAPKIGKMHGGILDRGDHGDEFKRDFVVYVVSTCIKGNQNGDAYFKILKSLGNEHANWVIHKHGQLHHTKGINKLITILVEGSSVSIPGMWLHTIMNLKVAVEFKLIILYVQKGRLLYMCKTLHLRSPKIKEFDIEYLELSWQDEVNVHDCGIFVMCHMESYQGQRSSYWDAGFGKKNKEQYLGMLRPMYYT
ncbi:hypothetical protein Cgig2_027995 [Carnegiea gigantea]|uniref:Ubiquitin-like protease family profile domain-containing protein n=1 Tax=Carnegiea gigantea TaxID=171969 RepID=A0A9Q1JLL9_9CARY|nr:hypothetical protein Cgig2_027995 [Carnegiea gigantea]